MVFSILRRNELTSLAERQSNDCEFQTEGRSANFEGSRRNPWADRAVWPPCWHLPGGPVGAASRWAATSDVEVGQTTYPVFRGKVVREGKEWSEGQNHKK